MKVESVKDVFQGAVSGQVDVTLAIDQSEANELRQALKIVDKYKKVAVAALAVNPTESEWHMVTYSVKNDKVIVHIKDGMIG